MTFDRSAARVTTSRDRRRHVRYWGAIGALNAVSFGAQLLPGPFQLTNIPTGTGLLMLVGWVALELASLGYAAVSSALLPVRTLPPLTRFSLVITAEFVISVALWLMLNGLPVI